MAVKQKFMQFTALLLTILILSGCGPQMGSSSGTPIEPIAPGMAETNSPTVGQFNVQSNEVQISDLSVTADASLTVVTAAQIVYLLEGGGSAQWEKELSSTPLKTYMDSDGKFLVIGTTAGRLVYMSPQQIEKFSEEFEAPVTHISASKNGDLLMIGVSPQEEGRENILYAMRNGHIVWEREMGIILETKLAGLENRVIVNWMRDNIPVLSVFSADGTLLWEREEHKQFAVDRSGQHIISTHGKEIISYNKNAEERWTYSAPGKVDRIIMSENGLYLAVLVVDEATQHEDILYLDIQGRKIWQKRLPVDADILVSDDGNQILVASWRQYQDDVTKIYVYNQYGQEVNVLDIAGRAQKMAYASQAETLVLGLEDGSIYFIHTAEKAPADRVGTESQLTNYYQPVSFTKEDGETRLQLFFFDEDARYLIPVTRSIKNSKSLLEDPIQELVRGPAQDSGLVRTIPKNAEIKVSLSENGGTVVIDLPASLDEKTGSTFLNGVLNSLLYTVSSIQIETIKQIRFTVAGNEQDTFGQDGIAMNKVYVPQPYGRMGNANLVFLPFAAKNRFYLRAETKQYPSLNNDELMKTIVQEILDEYNRQFTSNAQPVTLNSVRTDNNIIYVDFASTFNYNLINTPRAAAYSAMLRDAIALTLVENTSGSTVKFTVDGAAPDLPSHYKPWDLKVTRPYYINMEN